MCLEEGRRRVSGGEVSPERDEAREIGRNERRNRDWSTTVEKKGCNNSVP